MKADLKTAQSAVSALQHRIKKLNRDVAKKEISSDPTDVANKETSSKPIAMVLEAADDMEEGNYIATGSCSNLCRRGQHTDCENCNTKF